MKAGGGGSSNLKQMFRRFWLSLSHCPSRSTHEPVTDTEDPVLRLSSRNQITPLSRLPPLNCGLIFQEPFPQAVVLDTHSLAWGGLESSEAQYNLYNFLLCCEGSGDREIDAYFEGVLWIMADLPRFDSNPALFLLNADWGVFVGFSGCGFFIIKGELVAVHHRKLLQTASAHLGLS